MTGNLEAMAYGLRDKINRLAKESMHAGPNKVVENHKRIEHYRNVLMQKNIII